MDQVRRLTRRNVPLTTAELIKELNPTAYSGERDQRFRRRVRAFKNETLGNMSHLPESVIELILRSLQGETFVPASAALEITPRAPTAMSTPSRRTFRRDRM